MSCVFHLLGENVGEINFSINMLYRNKFRFNIFPNPIFPAFVYDEVPWKLPFSTIEHMLYYHYK